MMPTWTWDDVPGLDPETRKVAESAQHRGISTGRPHGLKRGTVNAAVIGMIDAGQLAGGIAKELGIAVSTVRQHVYLHRKREQ